MAAFSPPILNPGPDETVIIGVYANKGGVGKTTTSTNLAFALGSLGWKVLLLDVNAGQKMSSSRAVFEGLKVEPTYRLVVEDDPANLALVRQIPGFHFVIIDLPPSAEEAKAGLEQCDAVIVPAISEFLTARGVMETIRESLPEGPVPVVMMSRIPPFNPKRPPQKVQFLRNGFAGMGVRIFDTAMRQYACHNDAQAAGIPVTHDPDQYSNGDKAAADVRALADEVLAMTGRKAA